jgi:hypothetical protein
VIYKGHWQSLWTHLITPSRNLVEVQWWSLFWSTSLGKWCSSYNALPTSWKHAADCWSLWNFLPWSSLFMVGKAQKSREAYLNWILCLAWRKWNGGTPLEHLPYSLDLAPRDFWAFPTMKRESQGKTFWSDLVWFYFFYWPKWTYICWVIWHFDETWYVEFLWYVYYNMWIL